MGTATVETLRSFTSFGVGTDLTAHARRITFIGVNAGSGVIQRLASRTRAQWTCWGLDTAIGASCLGASTVIKITVRTLVSAVRTVWLSITDTDHGDADVGGVRIGTSPCALTAGYLDGSTRVDVLVLVTAISTVIRAITNVGVEDTLVVVTLEMISRAGDSATGVRLITFIFTICCTITVPTLGKTNTTLLTLELRLCIALVGGQHWTSLFITTIVTIRDTITLVRLMDTLLQVTTFELG